MKELTELRSELDALDRELVALLEKRLEGADGVAAYKLAKGLPVLDASREEQVIASRQAMMTRPGFEEHVANVFRAVMAMSRAEQERFLQAERERDAHA